VFISYASENREAARLIKGILESAGLEVWFDESELVGGDAWDQKIRRQIRECTYFMPVISAQTEARREGYFRREWRLAVDRSHDMADDAMFLIPVAIDATTEAGARVPEKFTLVQWLRCPGGSSTPSLAALAARLSSGEHSAVPAAAPPSITQARRPAAAPPSVSTAAPAGHTGPPPMPPFPHRPPDRRDRLRYLAEVVWWVLSTAWLIFQRFPRWVRFLIVLWLLFGVLFKSCSRTYTTSPEGGIKSPVVELGKKSDAESARLKEAVGKLDKLAGEPGSAGLGAGLAKAGVEIARAVSREVEDDAAWAGQLGLVPFNAAPGDAAGGKLADEVFSRVFSQLSQSNPSQVKVVPADAAAQDDASLAAAAAKAGNDYILAGRDTGAEIVVKLVGAKQAATLWTGHFPTEGEGSRELAEQICQGLGTALGQKAAKP